MNEFMLMGIGAAAVLVPSAVVMIWALLVYQRDQKAERRSQALLGAVMEQLTESAIADNDNVIDLRDRLAS